MIRKIGWSLFLLATLGFASAAQADLWAEADELFNQRKDNREAIKNSRIKYKQLLNEATTSADKLRAASQLGRLAIYEGEMVLPKDARDERREIFEDCWCRQPAVGGIIVPSGSCEEEGFIDAISPENLGSEHPAYYYFYGVCLAYWGEQGSTREKLAFTSFITWSIEHGQELDTRFDGGGIHRLAAGVYSNPQAAIIGLYDPEYAKSEIQNALAAEPFPGDPSSGALYYDNWKGMVEVLLELEDQDGALEILEEILPELAERIEDDNLPQGRAPEAFYNFKHMKNQYKTITGTDWEF